MFWGGGIDVRVCVGERSRAVERSKSCEVGSKKTADEQPACRNKMQLQHRNKQTRTAAPCCTAAARRSSARRASRVRDGEAVA